MDDGIASFWSMVEGGKVTALVGNRGRLPVAPRGWWALRIRCDGPARPLGPLLEAVERIEQLAGESLRVDRAAGRLARGIRRHLLGELPAGQLALEHNAGLARGLDRLADLGAGPCALLFEAVDGADAATLDQLLGLSQSGIRPAIVLGFRAVPAAGAAAALLAAAGARVHRVVESAAGQPKVDLSALSFEVRQTLRAGATVGEAFEVELVASLLGIDAGLVLERLQAAADAGVPLEDLGEGHIRLEETWVEALNAGLLPSLSGRWHRSLAGLLRPAEDAAQHTPTAADPDERPIRLPDPRLEEAAAALVEPVEAAPVVAPKEAAPDPFAGLAREDASAETNPSRPAQRAAPADEDEDPFSTLGGEPHAAAPPPVAAQTALDELFDVGSRPEPVPVRVREQPAPRIASAPASWGEMAPADEPAQTSASPAPVSPVSPVAPAAPAAPAAAQPRRPSPAARHGWRPDSGRAAGHLAALGDIESAVDALLQGARRAGAQGAAAHAEADLRRAQGLLERLPDTEARRVSAARVRGELARLRWESPRLDAAGSLSAALADVDAAQALLEGLSSPRVIAARAELRTLSAAIAYDLGDAPSLERALTDLSEASRERLSVGDARGGARLLNDAAAVWVRLGDPVRAAHLLRESQTVFTRGGTPEDELELAETAHLLASLPLHVAARPGLQGAAIDAALVHAKDAAGRYQALELPRELGRVYETMGRLELFRGALGPAHGWLARAYKTQLELGDIIGLARTAGGLSETLSRAGRTEEALSLLSDAIRLNMSKGSLFGLSLNRAALDGLRGRLSPEQVVALAEPLTLINTQLSSAEARLGQGAKVHA